MNTPRKYAKLFLKLSLGFSLLGLMVLASSVKLSSIKLLQPTPTTSARLKGDAERLKPAAPRQPQVTRREPVLAANTGAGMMRLREQDASPLDLVAHES